MKTLTLLIMIIFLASCTAAPTKSSVQNRISPTPAATITPAPATAILPSATSRPTEDISFYDVAACLPKDSSYQFGTVTKVIDGETIDVLLRDGKTVSVKYIGVDAPGEGEVYKLESYYANSVLVDQKEVILIKDVSETDQSGRLLRYVIVGNMLVNLEMLKTGFAFTQPYAPDTACAATFSSAEAEGRVTIKRKCGTRPHPASLRCKGSARRSK